MLDCWRHLMNGCFCLFLCNYFVQVSANTAEFIARHRGKHFVAAVRPERKSFRAELTAQPRRHHYNRTPTNPNTHTAWPLFFILGFVTVSPVMACNSRLLLGVSTFLCLYSVCLWACVCVCHISMISPGWPKYWQTVFNWGKLNGSHLNGAQTEAPRWRVTLWLPTCKAHSRAICVLAREGKLYCILRQGSVEKKVLLKFKNSQIRGFHMENK